MWMPRDDVRCGEGREYAYTDTLATHLTIARSPKPRKQTHRRFKIIHQGTY